MKQYIYVGRLDQEKGIESIIYCIHQLKDKAGIHFHIYGKGEYYKEIQDLSVKYPNLVSSYGRRDKKTIITTWKSCDYFLMPSQFLETFGLTACESLLLRVPVIGNKKGGLVSFIHHDLDIQTQVGQSDGEKLLSLIHITQQNTNSKDKYKSFIDSIHQKFSYKNREDMIINLLGESKPIAMISDFVNYDGGGIETHIHDNAHNRQKKGEKCLIYGHSSPQGTYQRIQKLIGMVLSICNIKDAFLIKQIIIREKIGLLWWHSISRVLGRFPVFFVSRENAHIKQIITHHELGLFHPYPSKVTDEQQLPKAWSLSSFLQSSQKKYFFQKLPVIGKYILVFLVHKQLQKHVHTHIVPSAWMVAVVKSRHPKAHVICIPHFVSLQ